MAVKPIPSAGVVPLNSKDFKRYKKMLEESKKALLMNARKTLMEESNFDTDDLPDEIDLASSEYTQSMIFRLRDREKFLLEKIERALQRTGRGDLRDLRALPRTEISAKRLEARPVTTLCIRCKEEQEKKEKELQVRVAGRHGASPSPGPCFGPHCVAGSDLHPSRPDRVKCALAPTRRTSSISSTALETAAAASRPD